MSADIGMTDAMTALLSDLLAPYGCMHCGVLTGPAQCWNDGERRHVPRAGLAPLRIAHDEREAPVALDSHGTWDDSLLVSLTDEDSLAACAWVQLPDRCAVAGLGIDLASLSDFSGERGRTFNPRLFTPREHELAPLLGEGDLALGYAYAFSAKEAGFKALAAPLREWYRHEDGKLLFDVRSLELADAKHEVGTARHAKAQQAMDAMGIGSIELARMPYGDMALTLAIALRR